MLVPVGPRKEASGRDTSQFPCSLEVARRDMGKTGVVGDGDMCSISSCAINRCVTMDKSLPLGPEVTAPPSPLH